MRGYEIGMGKHFKTGETVYWNSHGSRVPGKVVKVITERVEFKGKHYNASPEEPYYEVASDHSGGTAIHMASALSSKE